MDAHFAGFSTPAVAGPNTTVSPVEAERQKGPEARRASWLNHTVFALAQEKPAAAERPREIVDAG